MPKGTLTKEQLEGFREWNRTRPARLKAAMNWYATHPTKRAGELSDEEAKKNKLIARTPATKDVTRLRDIAEAMRRVPDLLGRSIPIVHCEAIARDLFFDALAAGAFSSPRYLHHRIVLADRQHFSWAIDMLQKEALKDGMAILPWPDQRQIDTFVKDGCPFVADCILHDIEEAELKHQSADDLPADGDWLLPPATMSELANRMKILTVEKAKGLLLQYRLRNYPADNRQSWTVDLKLMPGKLREQLDKRSARN